MQSKASYLNLYLGSRKRLWLEHCKKLNKKPGKLLREIIDQHLSINEPGNNPSFSDKTLETAPTSKTLTPSNLFQKKENLKKEPRSQIYVRLTESEKAKIEYCAKKAGCSRQIWILNVLRTVLTCQLECGTPELDQLGESNYQLLAIGRNLNQTVKHLNQGLGDAPTLNEILFLKRKIDSHTRLVGRAIQASIERWSIQ